MDDLPHLDYLDGRPSPPGSPGWANFTAWITGLDNLPHLDYVDGRPSPPGSPGWTTFPTWI
eukprot:8318279-Karenia_brevis.AAC.1